MGLTKAQENMLKYARMYVEHTKNPEFSGHSIECYIRDTVERKRWAEIFLGFKERYGWTVGSAPNVLAGLVNKDKIIRCEDRHKFGHMLYRFPTAIEVAQIKLKNDDF